MLTLLLNLQALPVHAQLAEAEGEQAQGEDEMITDRPDVAESASTVSPGRVQLETGLTLRREDGEHYSTLPTLIRVGLSDKWEFRVESDIVQLKNPGADSFSDFTVGAKVNFVDGEKTRFGLLMNLNVPVGIEEVRGSVDPSVKLLLDQELGGDFTLGFNVGATLTEDENDLRYAQLNFAASLSHPITENLTAYVEYYGEGPDQAGGAFLTAADTGLLYKLNKNLQLDVSYARGLSSSGLDWSVGTGVSARF